MQNIQTDCPVCFTPFKDSLSITLPCGCACCQSCLIHWVTLKIREFHFSFHQHIACFNLKCHAEFNVQNLLKESVPKSFQREIDQELLNCYLISTPDIRKCPNLNCSFAGIINTSAKCSDPLKCEVCQTTWRDPLHLKRTEKLTALLTDRNETSSSLWKSLWTKKCPGCQIPIQKYGGCPSMRCGYCSFEFCWICHSPHHTFKHFFKVALFYLFSIIGGLLSLYGAYRLVSMIPSIEVFIKVISFWGLKFLVWCLSFVIANVFLTYGIYLYEKARKYPDRWGFCWEEMVLFSSVGCAGIYYLELYFQLIIIILIEIPLAYIFYFLREKGVILNKAD